MLRTKQVKPIQRGHQLNRFGISYLELLRKILSN